MDRRHLLAAAGAIAAAPLFRPAWCAATAEIPGELRRLTGDRPEQSHARRSPAARIGT